MGTYTDLYNTPNEMAGGLQHADTRRFMGLLSCSKLGCYIAKTADKGYYKETI
jgi:hypothetical protein